MNRRELLAAAFAASMSGTAVGAIASPRRKIKVMLLGFCFSGAYAWDLKVAAHRWLDEARYDLSALMVASEALPVQVYGRLGRVPGHVFRPYGDLAWVRSGLKDTDVAVLLGDTRNAVFARAFARTMHAIRAEVPAMVYVTIEPWTLTEPGWMLTPAAEDVELRCAASSLADASYCLSERPAVERLGQAVREFQSGRETTRDLALPHDLDSARIRFDCLAAPVIGLFGRQQCRRARPSTLIPRQEA